MCIKVAFEVKVKDEINLFQMKPVFCSFVFGFSYTNTQFLLR